MRSCLTVSRAVRACSSTSMPSRCRELWTSYGGGMPLSGPGGVALELGTQRGPVVVGEHRILHRSRIGPPPHGVGALPALGPQGRLEHLVRTREREVGAHPHEA